MTKERSDVAAVLTAVAFAATKHCHQTRKDGQTPYINHPVAVAEMLTNIAGVTDPEVLAAALLHDTIEDTQTTAEELRTVFGERVLSLVLECTDDKELPKEERKRLQVEHAPSRSDAAKLIKIADKICNLCDMIELPPRNWSPERKVAYVSWSDQVYQGLRGGNTALDLLFEETRERTSRCLAQSLSS